MRRPTSGHVVGSLRKRELALNHDSNLSGVDKRCYLGKERLSRGVIERFGRDDPRVDVLLDDEQRGIGHRLLTRDGWIGDGVDRGDLRRRRPTRRVWLARVRSGVSRDIPI